MIDYGVKVQSVKNDSPCDRWWVADASRRNDYGTHQGLLINIRPIVRDSAEQFVKDMAAHLKFEHWTMNGDYWIERARRLMNKNQGGDL